MPATALIVDDEKNILLTLNQALQLEGYKTELASGGQGSQRDVELAARGFSEDEEKKYRGEKPDLAPAFRAIDAHVAAGEPAPEDMDRFAVEGGLGGDK